MADNRFFVVQNSYKVAGIVHRFHIIHRAVVKYRKCFQYIHRIPRPNKETKPETNKKKVKKEKLK